MTEESQNELSVQRTNMVADALMTRQSQEVQAAVFIAKKFPRDEISAYNKIIKSCELLSVAEDAEYTYPRGDTQVSGPTIRLLELIARNWGNIDSGLIELSNKDGQSEIMAFAWDLENNTRSTKIFTVKHWRDTKKGGYALKDVRDIYEVTANYGTRRERACLMKLIPNHVIEDAVNKCRETNRKAKEKIPLTEHFKKMVKIFGDKFKITQKQIEEYLKCTEATFTHENLSHMDGIFRSLRDNISKPNDYFKMDNTPTEVVTPSFDKSKEKQNTPDPDEKLREEIRKEHPGFNEWEVMEELEKRKKVGK